MRTCVRFAVVASTVVLLGAWASPAASPPPRFAISMFGFFSSPTTADGTWSSTGAIDEVGGFSVTFGGNGNAMHADMQLFGKQGSITMRGTLQQSATGTGFALNGQLRFVSGTGLYAGIKGHGGADLTSTSGDLNGSIAGIRTH